MKKLTTLLAIIAITATTVSAQKIKRKEGNPNVLKGEKTMNIVFKYDDMRVGKNLSEEEYIEKKVAEYNKKEAGTGDKWKKSWLTDREGRFEPKFLQLFNENTEKIGLRLEKGADTKYTLLVHTYYTEPGFNVGVMRKNASIHVRYTVIDSETEEVVVEWEQENVPGAQAMGYDFDTGSRIAESYAKAGKSLGKLFTKTLK